MATRVCCCRSTGVEVTYLDKHVTSAANLELLYDLVNEGDEVVEFADVGLLQQTMHRDRNERQYIGVETDNHAMKELSNSLMQCRPLDRHVQCMKEHLQRLHVHLSTSVQLHRLLAGKTFTCPTTNVQQANAIIN